MQQGYRQLQERGRNGRRSSERSSGVTPEALSERSSISNREARRRAEPDTLCCGGCVFTADGDVTRRRSLLKPFATEHFESSEAARKAWPPGVKKDKDLWLTSGERDTWGRRWHEKYPTRRNLEDAVSAYVEQDNLGLIGQADKIKEIHEQLHKQGKDLDGIKSTLEKMRASFTQAADIAVADSAAASFSSAASR